jgi:hypothetical protein
MKVQSTGLGKTVMLAHFQDLFKTRFEDQQVLQMNMESTEPLHWVIKVYMEPKDLRQAVLMGLKPSILWKAFLAIVFGRFSLFGEPGAAADEVKKETKAAPVGSEGSQRTDNDGGDDSPPAGLRNGSDDDAKPSPLASLKG